MREPIPDFIAIGPTGDPEYPGAVISIDGKDILLIEQMPNGKFAIRVWNADDPYNDPEYAQEFEPRERGGQ